MFKVIHKGQNARHDIGEYVYFVLSTGTYQTFAKWRQGGRPNPHAPTDYRRDMTTRTEITNLFFQGS